MAIQKPGDLPPGKPSGKPLGKWTAPAQEAVPEWPKIVHEVMTGSCHEKSFNDRDLTADTVKVVGTHGSHMMGVVSVTKEVIRNVVEDHTIVRYILKLNGVPLRALEFNARRDCQLGRLVATYDAVVGPMQKRPVPK